MKHKRKSSIKRRQQLSTIRLIFPQKKMPFDKKQNISAEKQNKICQLLDFSFASTPKHFADHVLSIPKRIALDQGAAPGAEALNL